MDDRVESLTVFDDGGGTSLCAGGLFTSAGGLAANRVARWNGTSWSPLGSGTNGSVRALMAFDDRSGTGPALYVGGAFTSALDSGDGHVARWQGCDTAAPAISAPDSVSVFDRLGSAPGEFVTFSVTAFDASDPAPSVVCVPPSGSFFPRGTTPVSCTATDAAGNESVHVLEVQVLLKAKHR